ncbi:MAG: HAD-IA family hydrolase [Armatimonadetes bacterium]|nr:HAD-IA family hydrolase [Armatimonadota bacterium]
MSVRAVTFDCAQTLLAVDWKPAALAIECAKRLGLPVDDWTHGNAYDQLLRKAWPAFVEMNLTRDEDASDLFWRELTQAWCRECGFEPATASDLYDTAERLIYGRPSSVFALYDDVIPCLTALRERGIKMAIVSNWDISLHKAVRSYGLAPFFDKVVASMEEGIEKPDPRIFKIALDALGIDPLECVHVGDNPLDDLAGARRAGMKAFVIDRRGESTSNVYISSLLELPERIGL